MMAVGRCSGLIWSLEDGWPEFRRGCVLSGEHRRSIDGDRSHAASLFVCLAVCVGGWTGPDVATDWVGKQLSLLP